MKFSFNVPAIYLTILLSIFFQSLNFASVYAQNGLSSNWEFDLIVYGGTSSAVTAAVQAKKMGKSVAIVSPDRCLGGLSSGGLGFTDSGNTSTIGGLAREFYRRIYAEYQKESSWKWQNVKSYANVGQGTKAMVHEDRTMWIFEPRVAEKVFNDWVAEFEIPVFREELLDRGNVQAKPIDHEAAKFTPIVRRDSIAPGVEKENGRVTAIRTLSGKRFAAKYFIDATYEGDLMAAAGVSFTLGREPNAYYGETWNGNQVGVLHHGHWFKKDISPYRIPENPESGLCRFVDDSEPGNRGEGDSRIQAYCFRLCLTDHPENRIPFTKPENYDPENYELLRRVLVSGWRELFHKFDRIPNLKTDTNNHGPFSSDFIGQNYEYPEASYAKRAEIINAHRDYQMGLLYFLANDPKVPEDVRKAMSPWGLAKDEFTETKGWPHQIYVREARRMVGQYVITEHDCFGKSPAPNQGTSAGSVGMGSYVLDSHNVRRYVKKDGFVQNEGDIGVHPKKPYAIDYFAITPQKHECENLLVPVCLSSSHIAFGSIRMEPVFMILGQSAATAACLALEEQNCAVQDLSRAKLSKRLKEDGQILKK
ncbi:MAG: FAD-dependent oxidoreductase [Planctomycetaceae bacterium]|nr:FAD-dependent oxidoreductase [Planctomycetaceae bacterium]